MFVYMSNMYKLFVSQMQTMLTGVREEFATFADVMNKVQYGDRILDEKIENNKVELQHQLADVVHMILALKVGLYGCFVTKNDSNSMISNFFLSGKK